MESSPNLEKDESIYRHQEARKSPWEGRVENPQVLRGSEDSQTETTQKYEILQIKGLSKGWGEGI